MIERKQIVQPEGTTSSDWISSPSLPPLQHHENVDEGMAAKSTADFLITNAIGRVLELEIPVGYLDSVRKKDVSVGYYIQAVAADNVPGLTFELVVGGIVRDTIEVNVNHATYAEREINFLHVDIDLAEWVAGPRICRITTRDGGGLPSGQEFEHTGGE